MSTSYDDDDDDNSNPGEIRCTHSLSAGDHVEVFWPIGDQYYPGTITAYNQSTGFRNVSYDDVDNQKLKMENETWCIQESRHFDVCDLRKIHWEALELYFQTFSHKDSFSNNLKDFRHILYGTCIWLKK